MSSRESEARFLHQNEVKFARQRNKMAVNLDLFHMHLHRQPNANTKLDLRSPIVDRDNSQTPLLRTPLGPEKVSVLRGVLIKRINFEENV